MYKGKSNLGQTKETIMKIWVDARPVSDGGTHVYFRPVDGKERRALEKLFDFKMGEAPKDLPADRNKPISQGGKAAGCFGGHETDYWIRIFT